MLLSFQNSLLLCAVCSSILLSATSAFGANGQSGGTVPLQASTGAEEEALLKKIQGLDKHGVGIKPLMVELARVDFLFRHGDAEHAQPRLDKLASTIKHHEEMIHEKEFPSPQGTTAANFSFPMGTAPRSHRGAPYPHLIPPPPPIALSPDGNFLPPPNPAVPGMQPVEPVTPTPRRYDPRARAMMRAALHLQRAGVSSDNIKDTMKGLQSGSTENERMVTEVLKKEVGGLVPAPGPMRMERFLLAERIADMAKRPRSTDPASLQRAMQYYRQVDQVAARTGDSANAKLQLAENIRGVEKMLRMPDVTKGERGLPRQNTPAAQPSVDQ